LGWGCFAAGTPIATPDGSTAIELLSVGDWVMAYDEVTHRVVPAPVVRTFRHEGQRAGELKLASGETLRVTKNHPIYLPDQLEYAEAGAVSAASRLIRLRPGKEVSSAIAEGFFLDSGAATETVFNIEVATHHNYFAGGVLVHNKQPACIGESKRITWSAPCDASEPCVDPHTVSSASPDAGAGGTSGADAGSEAGGGVGGGAGSAGTAGTAGGPGNANVGFLRRAFCQGTQPNKRSLIAFDVKTNDAAAEVSVVTRSIEPGAKCSANELAKLQVPGGGAWQSACTWFEYGELSDFIALVSANPQDQFRDLRFVANCTCELNKQVWNACGNRYDPRTSPNGCP
jgi:hypothetical protein